MTVRYSPAASNDLSDIWDYTEKTWNADQADRYVLSIDAACEAIADGGLKGRPADEFREGYFRLRSGSHYIFYRLADDNRTEIIRILHERMDLARHLRT